MPPEIDVTPYMQELTSGVPHIPIHEKLEDCMGADKWAAYSSAPAENPNDQQYTIFLSDMGIDQRAAEIKRFHLKPITKDENGRNLGRVSTPTDVISLRFSYNHTTDVIYILSAEELTRNQNIKRRNNRNYLVEDIIFCRKDNGNSFNIREKLGLQALLQISSQDNLHTDFGSYTPASHPDDYEKKWLSIYPLASNRPPRNPFARVYWNIQYGLSAMTLLHELGHTEQKTQYETSRLSQQEENRAAFVQVKERDAWRYALLAVRELRAKGIDLVPNFKPDQLVSRTEFVLLGSDIVTPKVLTERFSHKVRQPQKETGERINKIQHSINCMRALLKIIKQDPSLLASAVGIKIGG